MHEIAAVRDGALCTAQQLEWKLKGFCNHSVAERLFSGEPFRIKIDIDVTNTLTELDIEISSLNKFSSRLPTRLEQLARTRERRADMPIRHHGGEESMRSLEEIQR